MRPADHALIALLIIACPAVAACGGEGHEIFVEAGCHECHGDDLRGTPSSGPTLEGIGKNWDEERLFAYFRNPDSVAFADPRLAKLRELYGVGMAPLQLADPTAREKLAKYLLR